MKSSDGINTRFRIRRLIGTGSFGVVYEAFDTLRNRDVALKTLSRADGDSISRFKREFRSLAELRHRNLASLYELLVLGEEWALSMELVRGTDLLEHLVRRDPERVPRSGRVARNVRSRRARLVPPQAREGRPPQ